MYGAYQASFATSENSFLGRGVGIGVGSVVGLVTEKVITELSLQAPAGDTAVTHAV